MVTLAASLLLCWLVVLVARPRRPTASDEVQELVYARLCGRQQMLALLAFVATVLALLFLLVTLPQQIGGDLPGIR